ncbi:Serine/threonine protein kinase [Actinoplanes philippinensis]|uniref:non-specific serine/threonine protein kinase n=1 Tax=Actinoplanes philippinensis TaxID=35752 RepID=A0A1I2EIS8_9ACTN|nr:serine/threonine-protein kinase [Actinoplanes philippinensis]SFE92872.1 Serine/threonine protein kinase [Actinoplanes philippinensis]
MQTERLVANRYRLEEQIGSGGGGVVWRAVDERLGRPVALKRALSGDGDPQRFRQLEREAKLLAQLNHRHVVTIHDVLDDNGECWLVMEYVPARSMAELDVVAPRQAAKLGAQIADALAAVHAKGILHRDIKPGNVLMISDDEVKLADFGISRDAAGDTTVTCPGLLTGSPGYVAPEVANGAAPTAASDVFSLASTLFAVVEGESPVGSATDGMRLRLRRAANGAIASPRRSGELTPVLERMLRVDAGQRPTAAEAHEILADIAGVRPARHEPHPRFAGRRRLLVTAGVLVTVAAAASGIVFIDESGTPTGPVPTGPVLGADQRTADPCSLIRDAALEPFGDPNLVSDDSGFNQCNVIVKKDRKEANLLALIDRTPGEQSPVRAQDRGRYRLVDEPAGEGSCARRMLLPERYEIRIEVTRAHLIGADACAMTDAAVRSADEVITRGPVPERRPGNPTLRPDSFSRADACRAKDSPSFPDRPGIDRENPEVGFGRWKCTWTDPADGILYRLRFTRAKPLVTSGATRMTIDGRYSVIGYPGDAPGDDTCEVEAHNFTYVDAYGFDKDEVLEATVVGRNLSPEERCLLATRLATAFFPPR